jgi:hypothetical protein
MPCRSEDPLVEYYRLMCLDRGMGRLDVGVKHQTQSGVWLLGGQEAEG